jgi:hypothetical protein
MAKGATLSSLPCGNATGFFSSGNLDMPPEYPAGASNAYTSDNLDRYPNARNFPAQLVENVACMRERKEESSLFSYSDFSTRGVDSQRQSRQAELDLGFCLALITVSSGVALAGGRLAT